MSNPVKAYCSPLAPARRVLAALHSSREALRALSAMGARCEVLENKYARLYLPADPSAGPWGTPTECNQQVDALMKAFSDEAELFTRRLGAKSTNMENYPSLEVGVLLLLLVCAGQEVEERAEPTGSEKLVFMADGQVENWARDANIVVKRCSMARLEVVANQQEAGEMGLVLLLQDDVKRGSALAGLLALEEGTPWDVLCRYDSPAGPIFLPQDLEFSRSSILDTGRILESMQEQELEENERPYCIARMGDAKWVFRTDMPTHDAREIISDDISGERLSWRFLDLKQSDKAEKRLRDAIKMEDPNAGYRLSLHKIGPRIDDAQSLVRIREKISDMEAEAALVRGLRAPQTTLLRFSRAQLPAMADFLSVVRVGDIDAGKILYGFQATADEPGGVHFLHYDPAEIQLERPLREQTWRARTEDNPIRYWVDPHWAPFYTNATARVECRVFTPINTVIHPTLHSFAPEDMDAYIRQLIIRRISLGEFNSTIKELLEDRQRAVGLVFSRSRDEAFDVAVEILDLSCFSPLRQRLDWINDNLLMVDPAFVSEERVSAIAAALFEGRNADDLLKDMGARTEALETMVAESEDQFTASIEGLSKRFAQEFSAAIDHTNGITNHIELLSARLMALEGILVEVHALSTSSEVAGVTLDAIVADLEFRRETFEEGVRAKRRETIEFIEVAEKRLEAAHQMLADLQVRIERARSDV